MSITNILSVFKTCFKPFQQTASPNSPSADVQERDSFELTINTNTTDDSPQETNPVVKAAASGNLRGLSLLLDTSTNHNLQNSRGLGGKTALMVAAENGQEQIVNYLLNLPRTILNNLDNKGNNAAMHAAKNGHAQTLKKLINAVLDKESLMDQKNTDGQTALMLAVTNKQPGCVQTLLSHGANYKLRDNQKHNALDLAYMVGSSASAELIQDHINYIEERE